MSIISLLPPPAIHLSQKEMVHLKFSAKNVADLDLLSKSDPYLKLSRPQGKKFEFIKKPETIDNNLNPNWEVLFIPLAKLCDRDFEMKIKIEVYDEDIIEDDFIGGVQLSLNDMMSMAASQGAINLSIVITSKAFCTSMSVFWKLQS